MITTMIGKLSYLLCMWRWWIPITTVTALTTPSFRVIHPHPHHHNRLHRPPPPRFVSSRLLVKVDPYRDQNQIRPSLHPITINIIAHALKLRASASTHAVSKSPPPHHRTTATQIHNNDDIWPTQPLEVVLTVSALAQTALAQRQQTSRDDQMTFDLMEQQTIAGRVVGVMVRIQDLEQWLLQKCANVSYITKYDEWPAYGLLPPTTPTEHHKNGHDNETDNKQQQQLQLKLSFDNNDINIDPLLVLNRAECCLALFLHLVEIPELQRKNATVPDASRIDFLDADRYHVLVSSS